MTASEALQEIRKQVHRKTDNCDMTISKDCYKSVVSALEKQIPKKPYEETIATEDGYMAKKRSFFYCCPNCFYHLNENQNYCDDCGQALDWG